MNQNIINMNRLLVIVLAMLLPFMKGYCLNQGDIVFQTSKSAQSKYIALATGSIYTHCGVIVKVKGKDYVLEASKTVQLTPLDKWIAKGKFGQYKVRKCNKRDFKVNTKKYLNKPYDTQFKWDNAKMYCSELVYKVYQDNGITLCKLRKVKDYNIFFLKKYIKKRGISLEQLVVAPSDLL